MRNNTIYIAGPDGIGKTTFLNCVKYKIKENKTCHIWIRSPKIISKPLMAFCRLVGLTQYKTIDGIKYGTHNFYKSTFVSWLFPILQLLDFKIKWHFEKRKINKRDVVLFDRFSLDTLADLMVDTHKMDMHKSWIGKQFISLFPENLKIIILEVTEESIRNRKKDTLYDENLALKIKVYKILSNDLNLKVIDNNRDFKTVKEDILNYMSYE